MNAPPPDRKILPYARLAWDGATPRSVDVGDIYFSDGGVDETRHVFLDGNGLPERFRGAPRFVVGELGFGSGLNLLALWDCWRRAAKPPGARLHFLSAERAPFAPADLARAHAAWPQLAPLGDRLRAVLPPPIPGFRHLRLEEDVELTLLLGAAEDVLPRAEAQVDAWFLDGFAPAKNPDFWSDAIFAEMARLSAPGATLATYTVAGAVRRGLEAAGFSVERKDGYGRKRDMLVGRLRAPPLRRNRAPWFDGGLPPAEIPTRIAIIGGGVAGASLAFAARHAGLQPTVIERTGFASGASGNRAGLFMPRLDLGAAPASRFFVDAFVHAEALLRERGGDILNRCGVLLGAEDEASRARLARLSEARLLPGDWLQETPRGLFLSVAGALDPPRYVAMLLGDTPLIRGEACRLIRREQWSVEVALGEIGPFDAVILANSVDALRFCEARALPLTSVAGQIDWFADAAPPQAALAFGPYAAPAPGGGLVIGATYDRQARPTAPHTSVDATRRNLDAVASFASDLVREIDPARSQARASLRCQTPDRLPVAGPLPDLSFYAGAYDGLRTGLCQDYPIAEYIPGLHMLSGLGSRGLVTAPLLAEYVIAGVTGAPSPLAVDIAEALHPARFFIRDLQRSTHRRPRET